MRIANAPALARGLHAARRLTLFVTQPSLSDRRGTGLACRRSGQNLAQSLPWSQPEMWRKTVPYFETSNLKTGHLASRAPIAF